MEFSLTTMMRGIRRATRACILTKEYQRPTLIRLRRVGACSISRRRSTVIGWWIVTTVGRQPLDGEQAVAEALVVVDEVELAARGASGPARPAR